MNFDMVHSKCNSVNVILSNYARKRKSSILAHIFYISIYLSRPKCNKRLDLPWMDAYCILL